MSKRAVAGACVTLLIALRLGYLMSVPSGAYSRFVMLYSQGEWMWPIGLSNDTLYCAVTKVCAIDRSNNQQSVFSYS
jgi:hypothetical protein